MASYLTARRNTSQRISSGTWENVTIKWDVQDNQGNISYYPTMNAFGLRVGVTYRITAQLGWEAKTPEFYQFGLFDVDTGKQIGPLAEALPPNRNSCNASGGLLDVIHTPREGGIVVIRMAPGVKSGPSSSIRADVDTFLNIVTVDAPNQGTRRSKAQTIPIGETWANKVIVMNQVTETNYNPTGIDYDPYTGVITLQDERAYRITAQLGWEATTPEWYAFGLYDMDTGKQFGPLAESLPPNRKTWNASGGVLDVIITTGNYFDRAFSYQLKMAPNVTAGPSSEIRADVGTFLNIVEVPAIKSHLSTKCLTDQVYNTWKKQMIGMIIQQQYGDIKYYPNVGVFTLPGGKRYRITAQLGWEATTSEFYQFGVFNANTDQQIGPLAESLPPNRNTSNASGGVIDVIFTTPASGGEYCLRLSPNMTASSSSKIRADVSTYMIIVEL